MARSDQEGGDESMAMSSNEKLEEPDHSSSNWYFPREFIETDSPSRKDGIDLKKETNFRRSYCTFLQDLGMRLKVPQVTIATAIIFCHRFFLRQSHLKNDRYLIATTCMFLAGKVEETPKKLCDVILLSYEIRNKKDPTAVQKIKQKETYVEQQKEQVLLGERMVLATLGFDFNIHHPYKPLVAAIKKFKVAKSALAQVAWNFVNDGLRTSLCLQFKPHHIAAGAIFLAAKFLKVKLPSEGEKVWWQEFDVTPRQLEEVSNQMLELYEQNRDAPTSRMSDPSTSIGTNNCKRPTSDAPSSSAVQQSEMVENVKSNENLNGRKRSASEAFPVSVIEEDGNVEGDRKLKMNQNIKVDATDIDSVTVLASDNARKEQNMIDNNTCGSHMPYLANKATNNDVVGEMKSPTSCTSAIAAEISAGRVEESQSTGSTAIASESNVVEEVGSNQNSSEEAHPKTDWIGLSDLNIDRVKAAIQRRKQGDETRASVHKRELTDEEELLEMDLENGHKDNQQEEMFEYARDQDKNVERSDANLEKEIEHKSVEYLENDEDKTKNGHKRQIQPPLDQKFNANVENESRKEPQTPPG